MSRLHEAARRLRALEAESLSAAEESLIILYDVADVHGLSEQERAAYFEQLIAEKRAEAEAAKPKLSRGRANRQVDEGAVVLMPLKGSYTVDLHKEQDNDQAGYVN